MTNFEMSYIKFICLTETKGKGENDILINIDEIDYIIQETNFEKTENRGCTIKFNSSDNISVKEDLQEIIKLSNDKI